MQLNYSYNNFTFTKKPGLCYRTLGGLVIPKIILETTNARVTKSKGGGRATVDTMGGDFVSCLPRRRRRRRREGAAKFKEAAEKSRPNVGGT